MTKQPKLPPVVTKSREGKVHLCRCCVLDVITQGASAAEARRNLVEAVMLFHESTASLGSRDPLLAAAGFDLKGTTAIPPPQCRSTCCPCQPGEE